MGVKRDPVRALLPLSLLVFVLGSCACATISLVAIAFRKAINSSAPLRPAAPRPRQTAQDIFKHSLSRLIFSLLRSGYIHPLRNALGTIRERLARKPPVTPRTLHRLDSLLKDSIYPAEAPAASASAHAIPSIVDDRLQTTLNHITRHKYRCWRQ